MKIIYIDGGRSRLINIIGKFGGKWSGEGALVGAGCDENGKMLFQVKNYEIIEQIEAEYWSLLCAIKYCALEGIKKVKIMSDSQLIAGEEGDPFKSFPIENSAGKSWRYRFVAKELAEENEIEAISEWVPSEKNKAHEFANPEITKTIE